MKKLIRILLVVLAMVAVASVTAYAANVPTSIAFEVKNTLKGDSAPTLETFNFELTSDSAPLPETTTLQIKGAGTASFGEIWYDTTGVYTYQLKQIAGNKANYSYSGTVYDIHVYVYSTKESVLYIGAMIVTDQSGDKISAINFVNYYNAPDVVVDVEIIPETEPTPTPTATTSVITVVEETLEELVDDVIAAIPSVQVTETPQEQPLDDTTVEDEEVPLFAATNTEAWAWVNLVCMVLTILSSLVLLVGYFINKKDEDATGAADTKQTAKTQKYGFARLLSALVALVSIVLFILTEDMSLPMVTLDNWTIPMVILVLVQGAIMVRVRKTKSETET